jgi:hypothetical protein
MHRKEEFDARRDGDALVLPKAAELFALLATDMIGKLIVCLGKTIVRVAVFARPGSPW